MGLTSLIARRRGADPRPGRWGGFATDALHVVVLTNFAVAQPVLDLLSRNAEFFVVRRSHPVDVVLLVAILCIGLPLLGVGLESLVGLLGRTARRAAHTLTLSVLVAAIVTPSFARTSSLPGALMLLGSTALGAAAAVAYQRFRVARALLTALAPAPVVFAALFLASSPIRDLLRPARLAGVPAVAATTPVVLVVFDEFALDVLLDARGEIDAARYPNFARLGREATWFRNASTVSDATVHAVPAILTGRYPEKDRLPNATGHPMSLFTLLGDRYRLVSFESITELCQVPACVGVLPAPGLVERMRSLLSDLSIVYAHLLLPPDMTPGLPPLGAAWKDFRKGAGAGHEAGARTGHVRPAGRTALFRAFVAAVGPTDQPALFFHHVVMPHLPWRHLPSGKVYAGGASVVDGLHPDDEMWEADRRLVLESFQRHLLQVAYVDKLVGDLVARLEATGLYERALVVVTADHGISFRPGFSRRFVSTDNARDVLYVPLFVKLPGQRAGAVSDRNVETVDILPTIADALKIGLPWRVDGRSLLDTRAPDRRGKRAFAYKTGEIFAIDRLPEPGTGSIGQMLAQFEPGAGPWWLQRVGRYRGLVGRRVAALRPTAWTAITSELEWRDAYADLRLGSHVIPARVHGRLISADNLRGPLDLAVAINGIVQAVTQTSSWERRKATFSAMVPEAAFREGRNVVELFTVSETARGLMLARVRESSAARYALAGTPGSGGERLVSSEGREIPVVDGALSGWLDSVEDGPEGATIEGWAVDLARMQPAEEILVFRDGELEYAGTPDTSRYDVARLYGSDRVRRSGFEAHLSPAAGQGASSRLRAFAVSKGGRASEIHSPPAVRP